MAERIGFAVSPGDGTPLYYAVAEPEGEARHTVVLCDGIGCDGYVWKYVRRALGPDHRIVHWHYRGHGRSGAPRDAAHIRIRDLADDLAAVLDDCGVERAVLLGHSMGVQVALETYRRHRARVTGLGLLCGAPGRPLRTFKDTDVLQRLLPAIRFALHRAPRLFNGITAAVLPTRLSYFIATQAEVNGVLLDRADFMPYLEHLADIDVRFFADLLAQANAHDATDLLPTIAVPTLVIAGTHDGFTPAALSRAMHAAIPHSTLVVIDEGSHTAPLERPHLVTDAIGDFLGTVVPCV